MRRVTSTDIARRAGVSRSTVSFVINKRMDLAVAPETRERVLKAAEELGYVPNASARVLLTGRSQTIGICVQSLDDPHYSGLLNLLLAQAQRRGYHSLIVSGNDDSAPLLLAEGRADGLLVISDFSWKPQVGTWTAAGSPVVCVGGGDGSELQIPGVTYLHWDDLQGAEIATRHLIELGHRRIAMLIGTTPETAPKAMGYRHAMHSAGLEPIFVHCADEADLFRAGTGMMAEVRERYPDVTALFCRQDLLAVGALSWAGRHGLDIPGQLSVLGYNDLPMAEHTLPALTTIATPMKEAGCRALRILLDELDSGIEPGGEHDKVVASSPAMTRIELPVNLVKRASTGPPPSQPPL